MAAHSVNILSEFAYTMSYGATDLKLSNLRLALNCAAGMDELDLNRWRELSDLVDRLMPIPLAERRHLDGGLHHAVLLALRDQIAEWARLGFPTTHGEWMDAKYPPGDGDDS